MDNYTFRLACAQDEAAIRNFMHNHWDSPHPLIEVRDFFKYYYRRQDGALRFCLALSQGEICAIAGYIPSSFPDTGHTPAADTTEDAPCSSPKSDAVGCDVWVSLWVADPEASGAGLALMAEMPALTKCRTLSCNNIRPKTRAFYHFLGFTTARMGHFYHLAPSESYRIAHIAQPVVLPVSGSATLSLLSSPAELNACGFCPPKDANPYKDLAYISQRYFAFPRQSYDVYAAFLPGKETPFALLCTRLIPALGSAVLRIADYIGPPESFAQLGVAIRRLLGESGAEYADLYCDGIPENTLHSAGFALRCEHSEDIIPNYLSPPLIQNTEYYYFTSNPKGFAIFKADGDQDRPNIDLEN